MTIKMAKMKTCKLLAILSLLSSCTGGPTTFLIEDEFSPEEIELIHESADDWVRATDSFSAVIFLQEGLVQKGEFDANRHWYDGPEDFGLIWKISERERGYRQIKKIEEAKDFAGMAYDGRRLLVVEEDMYSLERFKKVMLHEFGHILGLGHHTKGLMKQGGDQSCIDEETVIFYCKTNHCGPDAGSTCK